MVHKWQYLKELWRNWINLLSIIVTRTTKATICRVSGLIRNVKRSSSIPFVLFLPSINRPLLKLEVLQQLSITYRTSNFRSCNNKKRIATSLLIVLTTTCVSLIHLNQVKTLKKWFLYYKFVKIHAGVHRLSSKCKCIKCKKGVNFLSKRLYIVVHCWILRATMPWSIFIVETLAPH